MLNQFSAPAACPATSSLNLKRHQKMAHLKSPSSINSTCRLKSALRAAPGKACLRKLNPWLERRLSRRNPCLILLDPSTESSLPLPRNRPRSPLSTCPPPIEGRRSTISSLKTARNLTKSLKSSLYSGLLRTKWIKTWPSLIESNLIRKQPGLS